MEISTWIRYVNSTYIDMDPDSICRFNILKNIDVCWGKSANTYTQDRLVKFVLKIVNDVRRIVNLHIFVYVNKGRYCPKLLTKKTKYYDTSN